MLSRSVEEGATMTTALIPWTTAGAFYAATLGVSVLDYAPYAFFNYLNAIVSIALATAGIGLLKKETVKETG
jgi:NhaC family Na+:H+ antiporter